MSEMYISGSIQMHHQRRWQPAMFTGTARRLAARSLSPSSWSASVRIAAHCQILKLRAFAPGPSADHAPAPLLHPFGSLHAMNALETVSSCHASSLRHGAIMVP